MRLTRSCYNSTRAKRGLDAAYGIVDGVVNFERMRTEGVEKLALAIAPGGLANIKARRIKQILDDLYDKTGSLDLDYLRQSTDEEAMRELVSFEGVGPKTASCVLLFCLGRDSFAVDT